ncbi:MAG: PQQ-dependent sugar dehydrogenase [Candidatus Neomarinimicrobiota bacterium]
MIRSIICIFVLQLLGKAQNPDISSRLVADGFVKPIYVTSHPQDAGQLFVLEQKGIIKIVQDGEVVSKPFLNITDRVHNPITPGDERGLLGLAFHGDYERNGYLYVNYVNKKGESIISRFETSRRSREVDPTSESVLIRLAQPFSNHNGGHLAFGPKDGYLYIALGDGGKLGDPFNHAQSLDNLFGKILRIDVDGSGPYGIPPDNPFANNPEVREEIWVYGLRNPWRFSFDRATGDMYIGDVGQDTWEEIDFQSSKSPGAENYGWRIMEGNHCYDPPAGCGQAGLIKPIWEYSNDADYMRTLTGMSQPEVNGCSVTGGYVYRGKRLHDLQGTYFFADYCSGNIWSFQLNDNRVTNFRDRTREINLGGGEYTTYVSSFGEDALGELYVVDYNGGVYKIVPAE